MHDPLYQLKPNDEDWWPEFGEEAESLFAAIVQQDDERRDRKLKEIHHAIHKLEGGEDEPDTEGEGVRR